MQFILKITTVLSIMVSTDCVLHAEAKPGSLFSDNAVLQRNKTLPVWGTAGDGEKITLDFAGHHSSTVATNGRWMVHIPPLQAGGPFIMNITGESDAISLTNILIGDVWLCSGQSNMQFPVKESAEVEQKAELTSHPQLRLCSVAKGWKPEPQTAADIKWQVCTPDSVRNFSAVAYYFASELLKDPTLAKVPIGVIDSSFGGTTCEGWIPKTALDNFDPKILHDSMFGIKPAMLYNAMIAPLGNAPIKGVIWYQGESNSGHPDTYPRLLKTMIAEWRKQFELPQLPFFIIELPDYASQWDGFFWPWEREAQAQVVAATSDTALVMGIDTTDGFNLHPKQKLEIGRRTALLVRHDVYGENIVASGPVFKNADIRSSTVRVTFDTGGNGLASSSTNGVRGFELAGDDGIYHFAKATIEGDSVIVQCDEVPSPKTIRYAWEGVPNSTLVNRAGLPAAPFRTDNFPYANIEVQKEPVSHQVTTSAYHISVDGNGQITGLAVRGAQFLSNEPGMAGGTSIPAMFGPRSLPDIQNLGAELLSCSDGDVTFLLLFKEDQMVWTLTNRGNDKINFNIALSSQVKVDGQGGLEPVTLTHKKSFFTMDGIDSVSDSDNGKVLHVVIKGKSSRQIVLNMSEK